MHIETIVNGGVSILLSPENAVEEELLKQLTKQELDIQEIRTQVFILGKSFKSGILIGKKSFQKGDGKESEIEDEAKKV